MTLLLTITVTKTNTIGISFGSPDIKTIITGGLILLIAWVMDEGRKLKEEHDQVI